MNNWMRYAAPCAHRPLVMFVDAMKIGLIGTRCAPKAETYSRVICCASIAS